MSVWTAHDAACLMVALSETDERLIFDDGSGTATVRGVPVKDLVARAKDGAIDLRADGAFVVPTRVLDEIPDDSRVVVFYRADDIARSPGHEPRHSVVRGVLEEWPELRDRTPAKVADGIYFIDLTL